MATRLDRPAELATDAEVEVLRKTYSGDSSGARLIARIEAEVAAKDGARKDYRELLDAWEKATDERDTAEARAHEAHERNVELERVKHVVENELLLANLDVTRAESAGDEERAKFWRAMRGILKRCARGEGKS